VSAWNGRHGSITLSFGIFVGDAARSLLILLLLLELLSISVCNFSLEFLLWQLLPYYLQLKLLLYLQQQLLLRHHRRCCSR